MIKAIRKSDGKEIQVEELVLYSLKTGEPKLRGYTDKAGHEYSPEELELPSTAIVISPQSHSSIDEDEKLHQQIQINFLMSRLDSISHQMTEIVGLLKNIADNQFIGIKYN